MSHPKPKSSVTPGLIAEPLVEDHQMPSQKASIVSHHSDKRLSIRHYISRPENFTSPAKDSSAIAPLYTVEERRRRDASRWTIVQAALAPIQFGIFLVSLCLVVRYLATGEGLALATASVVVKTIALYTIMITGSIWEHEVFGRYLFARSFFWEDVFSILVLALHTIYLAALALDTLSPRNLMLVALAAYTTYVINAMQFLLKLRAARRQQPAVIAGAMGLAS
jgi:3-vinyl bacteriochlorophyllide hydratase